MSTGEATGERTIETRIPARLDRLPWSRFHWMIVIGLGTVWILDGLEVTIVGSIASRLTEAGSGIAIDASQIGTAAAFYVAGACIGALFFGQLTDRFGRKKLFLVTLGVYIVATIATAFAFAPWYFFVSRFFTGAGIGGEYAAINSAIDELIPARVRGRVDLIINGSYWVGAAAGALASLALLDTSIFAADFGWRLAFGIGAVLGVGILIVRRHVPESPRWLFIHGREEEAEGIVDEIEDEVREETGEELAEPEGEITVRQRERIPFREIARTAFVTTRGARCSASRSSSARRSSTTRSPSTSGRSSIEFFDVGSGDGAALHRALRGLATSSARCILGRLFDTVGRKPMIAGTYLGSALVTAALGFVLLDGGLTTWSLHGVRPRDLLPRLGGRELRLPDGQRDLPDGDARAGDRLLLRGRHGGRRHHRPAALRPADQQRQPSKVAIGFFIGAGVMAIGGIAELLFGVKAEQQPLEDIAEAADRDGRRGGDERLGSERSPPPPPPPAAPADPDLARDAGLRARIRGSASSTRSS